MLLKQQRQKIWEIPLGDSFICPYMGTDTISNATTLWGTGNAPSQTIFGPMHSASISPKSCETMVLDSHTIPILFGTIGVTLASLSLVVNIAFGILQVRAINKCTREDLESGKDGSPQLAAAGSTSQPVDVTNQRPSLHKVVHELDASEPLQCANPWFILLLGRKPANLLFLAIHPMTRRNCPNHLRRLKTRMADSLLRLRAMPLFL
jgi:hypothetical protein